jgi:hypothetical protein
MRYCVVFSRLPGAESKSPKTSKPKVHHCLLPQRSESSKFLHCSLLRQRLTVQWFLVVSHVWMAPRLQGFFCVWRGRLRSCVRPMNTVAHGPLALMGSAD